ncbi:MAG: hypothetical protein WCQ90_01770 [Deltaproteobacteria bacterium]
MQGETTGLEGADSSYIGGDDFVRLSQDDINISFHIKNPNHDILALFRTVKRAQSIIQKMFGYNPGGIDIHIYNSKEEMRQEGRSRSRYASWIAGIYDGEIRVISELENGDTESLCVVLTHEITHLALDLMCHGNCPDWLNEGLAVCISQQMSDQYRSMLQNAIKNDKTIPIEVLSMRLFSHPDENIRQLAYAEAASIIEYLIETQGWESIAKMVSLCRNMKIENVFYSLGLSNTIIEMGWELWLKGKQLNGKENKQFV